ncbi:MAG: hypothetical protein HC933_21895 [Pleurocapsa sp. SU_196_0]|nr:hypothetical protein [Pleurocapsa sp. SU_196_0]
MALGLLVLGACTGSKEDNPNLKLVLGVRGSSAFSVFCAGSRGRSPRLGCCSPALMPWRTPRAGLIQSKPVSS